MILSALAAATFSAAGRDQEDRQLRLGAGRLPHRASRRSSPIYADPDNIPRDQAVGDEHGGDPREPALEMAEGDGGGEDGDGGGAIVAGGRSALGRPSATPRVRGAGKAQDQRGREPARRQDRGPGRLAHEPAARRRPPPTSAAAARSPATPSSTSRRSASALDQLAREILRHLKDHKLTVVWLFDESVSMQDDQRTILEKFDRVSSELKKNIDPDKKSAGALNHAIVGFGQGIDFVLEKPRDDIDQIGRAIKKLRTDTSGIENTMQAIREIARAYAGLIGKDRKVLMVLVTDESGDDGADVEEARQALKKYKVPLYVIGRQSLFGYPFAHHRYVDPVTKDVYHPLIRRGPETADLELYQWDGLYDRWDEQPSGFAPWELARLTKDSGGIYFLLPSEEFMRVRQREQAYSIVQLKEYLPEYDNRLTYIEKRDASPTAAQTCYADRHGEPRLHLPPRLPDRAPASWSRRPPGGGQKATVKLNALLEIQKRLESLKPGSATASPRSAGRPTTT